MAAPTERPGEMIHGINVTPLVDIVLVLLIVLMVTASHAASLALPMELPSATSGEANPAGPFVVNVAADGSLHLDGKLASREQVRERARRERGNATASALIAADGAAAHRAVVAVIDILRSEGVTRFAINVAPEDVTP